MKIFLTLLTFLVSAHAFQGAYIGAGAGVTNTSVQYKFSGINQKDSLRAGDSRSGEAFNVFVGYGWLMNRFFVAPEFCMEFANQEIRPFDTSDSHIRTRTLKVHLKRTWSAAAGVRFGYVVKPDVLAYIGLGVSYTPWELKICNIADYQNTPEARADKIKSKKNAAFAINPSLGLEIKLTDKVFGRLNYSVALPIRMTCNQNFYNVHGFRTYQTTTLLHSIKAMTQTLTVGVGMRF